MGLKCMTGFVQSEGFLRGHKLHDTALVLDGTFCIMRAYRIIRDDPAIGCDYEDYSKYIKRLFNDFKECNVRCYVVFDGGHNRPRMQKKLDRIAEDADVDQLFLHEIVAVILKELQIPYVFCCSEVADSVVVALASFFSCPILSSNSDFFLTSPPVILFDDCYRNPSDHFFNCVIFNRSSLLQQFFLNDKKMPVLFLLLQKNNFEERFFDAFLMSFGITRHIFYRIRDILWWLSARSYDSAVQDILNHVPLGERQKCRNILEATERNLFCTRAKEGYAFKFLLNPEAVIVEENDPEWFEKGVVKGHIHNTYIDMCIKKMYVFSPQASFLPCLRILRYAFDLLTGFRGENFQYVGKNSTNITAELSITKPYCGDRVPFHNGWTSLPDYFGHFVRETLPGLPYATIEEVPVDCRLWMLALVWWRMHAAQDASLEAHCLLLCRARTAEPSAISAKISATDLPIVYPYLAPIVVDTSINRFHHVLHQFDCLSQLCAAPYKPIHFHEAYCDSFLRGTLDKMKLSGVEPGVYAAELVREAPLMRQLYEELLAAYERCIKAVTIVV